jgi:RNA polymerase sigma-70 factor (ECF subfamily)
MAPPGPETSEADRFGEWVRRHGRAVRGYLLAMVRRPDVADDLAQEVFCRAWQARDRYREQGTPRAYLIRIADRLLCDRGRRAGRETTLDTETWKGLEPVSRNADPFRAAADAEAIEQLAAAMERLSDVQRRVLLLRYYGQLAFSEIAQTVGCPLNTTLSHCRRGLQMLRRLLVEEVR